MAATECAQKKVMIANYMASIVAAKVAQLCAKCAAAAAGVGLHVDMTALVSSCLTSLIELSTVTEYWICCWCKICTIMLLMTYSKLNKNSVKLLFIITSIAQHMQLSVQIKAQTILNQKARHHAA